MRTEYRPIISEELCAWRWVMKQHENEHERTRVEYESEVKTTRDRRH